MDITSLGSQFVLGLTVGLFIGTIIGYMVAKRRKDPDSRISAIQVLAFLILIIYVGMSFAFKHEPSWVIAVGILATGYGAKGGEILEKLLEKGKK